MLGIDDGVIRKRRPLAALMALDVQLARTVATLAPHRVAAEDRLPKLIQRALDLLDLIAMANQTPCLDRPVEVQLRRIARRDIPEPSLAEPANGRLKQPPVNFRYVRFAARPRTHG